MNKVEEIVLKCHNDLLAERGINIVSDFNTEMNRENGIDSLGLVSLILQIEDELGMDLDECLADIRNSKTVGEVIQAIQKQMT